MLLLGDLASLTSPKFSNTVFYTAKHNICGMPTTDSGTLLWWKYRASLNVIRARTSKVIKISQAHTLSDASHTHTYTSTHTSLQNMRFVLPFSTCSNSDS